MKINLEFGEDEIEAAELAMKACSMSGAITEALNYIRGVLKHTECSLETVGHLEKVREILKD